MRALCGDEAVPEVLHGKAWCNCNCESYAHLEHQHFLTKERVDQEWAPIARTKQMRDEAQFYYECFPVSEQSTGAKLAIVGLNIGKDKARCDFCQKADQ